MRGGIQKKGNNYYAVIYDGIDPGTGRKRRRWVPAGTRRADAERVLADLVRRKHEGEPTPTEKLTLAEYLVDRWLPIQKSRLRASTYDSYRRNIELHVLPALGKRQLHKLTVDDIDLFYATLLTRGRKPGGRGAGIGVKGLAPKTVHNIHVMLNKALGDAARKGTVIRNVVELADAPSLQARKRPEVKAWEVDQLVEFLDKIARHRMGPAFYFAAHTGMRRGEVLGVRWRDLDLDASRVSVRQALVSVAYETSISDVKTGMSRRTIDIDADVVQVLRDWRKARTEERDGLEPGHDDLVFVKADGTSMHPDIFSALRPHRSQDRRPGDLASRLASHPCHVAAQGWRPCEGGERATRPCQCCVHNERVSAPPPRHAGGGRRHLRRAHPPATNAGELPPPDLIVRTTPRHRRRVFRQRDCRAAR